MIIELHLLQNFAPSCLNRDDLNAPKDCYFGGKRRARISSQCFKRATRMNPVFAEALSSGIGKRTRLLKDALVDWMETKGKDREEAAAVVEPVVASIGSGVENDRSKIALYLGMDEIERVGEAILEKYAELAEAAKAAEEEGEEGKKKAAKKPKKGSGTAAAKEIADAIAKSFKPGTKAADIALFGRMIAEATNFNVDAAAQVAHAISTNAIELEYDYFTAVDDLQPKGDPGAGMIGSQQFNSACFYRYANVHLEQLAENLGKDTGLAREAALAFVSSFVTAIPSAKQNSHAAHNPPDFVLVVIREHSAPLSLANAFVNPAAPKRDRGLVDVSVSNLAEYFNKVSKAYGSNGVVAAAYFALVEPATKLEGAKDLGGLQSLQDELRGHLAKWAPAENGR